MTGTETGINTTVADADFVGFAAPTPLAHPAIRFHCPTQGCLSARPCASRQTVMPALLSASAHARPSRLKVLQPDDPPACCQQPNRSIGHPGTSTSSEKRLPDSCSCDRALVMKSVRRPGPPNAHVVGFKTGSRTMRSIFPSGRIRARHDEFGRVFQRHPSASIAEPSGNPCSKSTRNGLRAEIVPVS